MGLAGSGLEAIARELDGFLEGLRPRERRAQPRAMGDEPGPTFGQVAVARTDRAVELEPAAARGLELALESHAVGISADRETVRLTGCEGDPRFLLRSKLGQKARELRLPIRAGVVGEHPRLEA